MLNFKTKELAEAAGELGLTDTAVQHCVSTHDIKEAEGRWQELQKSIKSTYRRLALELHPDRNPSGAERFARLSNAYQEVEAFFVRNRPVCDVPARFMVPMAGFVVRPYGFGDCSQTTTSTTTWHFGWQWWAR